MHINRFTYPVFPTIEAFRAANVTMEAPSGACIDLPDGVTRIAIDTQGGGRFVARHGEHHAEGDTPIEALDNLLGLPVQRRML